MYIYIYIYIYIYHNKSYGGRLVIAPPAELREEVGDGLAAVIVHWLIL